MLPHKPKRHTRFLIAISLLMLATYPAYPVAGTDNVFWFRSYNPPSNLYTISADERNTIFEFYSDTWRYEGAAWAAYSVAPDADAKPVYRLYRESPLEYFLTISENQKNRLMSNGRGWIYDGIVWYAYDYPREGTTPIYRVDIPRDRAPVYTPYNEELQNFLARSPSTSVEGIAWYAYPPDGYTDPVPMEPVTGGCFDIGNQGDGIPWVCVDDFQMGRYEVTQSLWEAIMGEDPARWFYDCADCPVENLNWHEAQNFIARLNQVTNRAYRLPTEAEWEYACRSGGAAQTYCGGEDVNALAWYAADDGRHPHEVGLKVPNGLGLYDMSGNVMEWTCSTFNTNYLDDTRGCGFVMNGGVMEWTCSSFNTTYLDDSLECGLPLSLGYRVVRGGSWSQDAVENTSTYRIDLTPATQSSSIGLRLAHD